MPHGVSLALALVALVLLPCLVALLVINVDRLGGWPRPWRGHRLHRGPLRRTRPVAGSAPPPARRAGSPASGRLRSSWQERWTLLRLERALAREPADLRFVLDALGRPDRPPIERIASDLRRLGRHRLGLANQNPVWHEAVRRAYDDQLRLACGCLGIQHHLTELDGLDLEIERVRVEGELRAAGLFFGEPERRPDHGQDRR
jgi:hypothetical protein